MESNQEHMALSHWQGRGKAALLHLGFARCQESFVDWLLCLFERLGTAMLMCLNSGEKLYPEFLQVIKSQGKLLLKGQVIFVANNAGDCKGCLNSKQISRSLSAQ